MKLKTIIAVVVLCSFVSGNMQAQSLSDILGKAKSAISTITGAESNNVTGTWVYESTKVNFTSDNLLAQAGSKLVSSKIEDQINSILNKYGLTPQNLTLAFAEDGNYTCSFTGDSAKITKGKYSFKDGKLVLTPSVLKKDISINAKSGNALDLTCNDDKLLTLVQGLSSLKTENSTIKTISEIAKNYDGMQIGLTFKKK